MTLDFLPTLKLPLTDFKFGDFLSYLTVLFALQDFSATKEMREDFLHKCNSVFDAIIRIPGTSGVQFPALRQKKKDANDHWNSLCTESETEITRKIDTKVSVLFQCVPEKNVFVDNTACGVYWFVNVQ